MAREKLQFAVFVLFRIFFSVFIIGWLFKIMRWPFSGIQIYIGTIGVIVFYFIRFLLKDSKELADYVKLFFIEAIFSRALIFLPENPELNNLIHNILSIGLIAAAVILVIIKPATFIPSPKKNKTAQLLFAGGGLIILFGALFKIMHWPFAGILLVLGMLITATWLIIEPFLANKAEISHSEFDTLDEVLVSDFQDNRSPSAQKNSKLSDLEKILSWAAGAFMVIGISFFFLDFQYAGLLLLIGFICGGLFILLTLRN